MSSQTPALQVLIDHCAEHMDALQQALGTCFGSQWELELREPTEWKNGHESLQELGTAGLFLVLKGDDEQSFLLALPETLPLPDWYRHPDDQQQQQLQTLADEWARLSFPAEKPCKEQWIVQAHDLSTAMSWSSPLGEALVVEIPCRKQGEDEAEAGASMWLFGPVETPPGPAVADTCDEWEEESEYRAYENAEPQLNHETELLVNRIRRLMPLTITVSVRLAEMKIELSSLVNLCPGTLLVFPKSCDDLLDLYVNNQLYAQGEAVKIGEKFGLKINQVGVKKHRKSGVFSL